MIISALCVVSVFVFKQKTAYELRISDWSSDVCSSDLRQGRHPHPRFGRRHADRRRGLHDAQAGFWHRDLRLTPDWRRRRRNAKTADMTHALRCAARATPVLATLFLAIGPASAAEQRLGLPRFETLAVTATVMVERSEEGRGGKEGG